MTLPRETVLCRYHYDPLDQLIGHALPDTHERQLFYCKSRLATEIQGALRYSIVQHGDQLLAQQRSERDATSNTMLSTDQQRSVLQALEADHPSQPIAYSPYGHRAVDSGLLSLLGFNGERPDPVTGCYLLGNGYRAFNPLLMRFNSPDSWSPFGKGGLNAYAYCAGEPVNRRDPTGHSILWKALMIFSEKNITPIVKPTSALGSFEALGRYENFPHIYEKIMKQVKGKYLDRLAQASSEMYEIVEKSVKQVPLNVPKDDQVTFLIHAEKSKRGVLPSKAHQTLNHKNIVNKINRYSESGKALLPSEVKIQERGHINMDRATDRFYKKIKEKYKRKKQTEIREG